MTSIYDKYELAVAKIIELRELYKELDSQLKKVIRTKVSAELDKETK